MPKVIHFEIPAVNAERAVKFYESAFGWKFDKYGPMDYYLATAGDEKEPGINGAITTKGALTAATTNTIGVASFEDAVKKIVAAGGEVLMPKTAVQGVGYMAYCRDTEGNVFGIMQSDPNAK